MLASRSLRIAQDSATRKNSEEQGIQARGTFKGVCYRLENKDDMIDLWKLRAELRMLGAADLLRMASNQKEHHCVLNPNGPCQFYFKYKGFGFCVSEFTGQGCRAEKARAGEH